MLVAEIISRVDNILLGSDVTARVDIASFVGRVRRTLLDEDNTDYRWTDDILADFINTGVREIRKVRVDAKSELDGTPIAYAAITGVDVAGGGSLVLPDDFFEALFLYVMFQSFTTNISDQLNDAKAKQYFELFQSELAAVPWRYTDPEKRQWLEEAVKHIHNVRPDAQVNTSGALITAPEIGGSTTEFELDAVFTDAVVYYICWKAFEKTSDRDNQKKYLQLTANELKVM